MPHILQPPVTDWDCERCPAVDQTRETAPHTRFHACPAVGGAQVPMRAGGRAGSRVVLNEREDYIGGELVRLIDGRPVMNAVTEHADGHVDCAVYAPTARTSAAAHR
jgi:hypothetical protein